METTKEILAILGKPVSDTLPREQNPNHFSLEFLPDEQHSPFPFPNPVQNGEAKDRKGHQHKRQA